MIMAAEGRERQQELLETLYRALEECREWVDESNPGPLGGARYHEYKFFTDNVVITYPGQAYDRDVLFEPAFGFTFHNAAFFQCEMTIRGFFMRGGLDLGPMHSNPNTVFGRPLLEAHRLESKIADFPRVLVSENVRFLACVHLGGYESVDSSLYFSELLADAEGKVFLNYLDTLRFDDVVDWEKLSQHRDWVARRRSEFADDERVGPKYEWSRDYHNFYCVNFLSGGYDVGEFLIEPDLPGRNDIRTIKGVLEPIALTAEHG